MLQEVFIEISHRAIVQLSSKVTFTRVQNTPLMHPRHILDVSRMRFGYVPRLAKKGMAVNQVLLQLYREVLCLRGHVSCTFRTCLVHAPDASRARSGCISYMFWMHLAHVVFRKGANVTLELNCTVYSKVHLSYLLLLFIYHLNLYFYLK